VTITTDDRTIELDNEQRRVAQAPAEERLCVTAGPGSGKTETVSARIQYLLEAENLSGNEVLVISFSRAAVEAIQRRQRLNGARSWVWVTTLDSLATRILSDTEVDVTGLGFDTRIKRLAQLLANDEIEDPLPDVRHVIIDEAQDVVGVRAALVRLLLESLPEDVGFTMLGDPRQGIYDFQLEENFDDPNLLLQAAQDLHAVDVELRGQYRAQTDDARLAMTLRGTDRADIAWINEMQRFVTAKPSFDLDGLAEQLNGSAGDFAILTQSNAQALTVARRLQERGVQIELLARAADRSIDPWLAEAFADAPGSLTRDQFEELAREVAPIDPSEAWSLCRRITSGKTKFLNVRELTQRLASGIVPCTGLRASSSIRSCCWIRTSGTATRTRPTAARSMWLSRDLVADCSPSPATRRRSTGAPTTGPSAPSAPTARGRAPPGSRSAGPTGANRNRPLRIAIPGAPRSSCEHWPAQAPPSLLTSGSPHTSPP
jgi:DNA helicase-2/ATP-dependent DNA helicase PcrA